MGSSCSNIASFNTKVYGSSFDLKSFCKSARGKSFFFDDGEGEILRVMGSERTSISVDITDRIVCQCIQSDGTIYLVDKESHLYVIYDKEVEKIATNMPEMEAIYSICVTEKSIYLHGKGNVGSCVSTIMKLDKTGSLIVSENIEFVNTKVPLQLSKSGDYIAFVVQEDEIELCVCCTDDLDMKSRFCVEKTDFAWCGTSEIILVTEEGFSMFNVEGLFIMEQGESMNRDIIDISAEGENLAVLFDRELCLYSLEGTIKLVHTIDITFNVEQVHFERYSPNILIFGSETLLIYNHETMRPVRFEGSVGKPDHMEVSDDEKHILTWGRHLRIFDRESRALVFSYTPKKPNYHVGWAHIHLEKVILSTDDLVSVITLDACEIESTWHVERTVAIDPTRWEGITTSVDGQLVLCWNGKIALFTIEGEMKRLLAEHECVGDVYVTETHLMFVAVYKSNRHAVKVYDISNEEPVLKRFDDLSPGEMRIVYNPLTKILSIFDVCGGIEYDDLMYPKDNIIPKRSCFEVGEQMGIDKLGTRLCGYDNVDMHICLRNNETNRVRLFPNGLTPIETSIVGEDIVVLATIGLLVLTEQH
ncbi:hypothetical protein PCE1_004659 [Barthelona sp. PCE]